MGDYESFFDMMKEEGEVDDLKVVRDFNAVLRDSRGVRLTHDQLVELEIHNKIKFLKVDISKAVNISKMETYESLPDTFFSEEVWVDRIEEVEALTDFKDLTITSKEVSITAFIMDKFFNGKHIFEDIESLPIYSIYNALKLKGYIKES